MRWFSKASSPVPSSVPQPPKVEVTHILGVGMEAHGDYRFEGGLLIDHLTSGRFEGKGPTSAVLVSPTGQVEGPVSAHTIVAAGRIQGSVRAHAVWLHASAVIEGDIQAATLHIEPGARWNGQSHIHPEHTYSHE